MNCPYCKESFDSELRKPIKLPCLLQHRICESCAKFLKTKSYICPFDNLRINIDLSNVDTELLEKVKTFCIKHNKQSDAICLNHLEFVCEICLSMHSHCELVNDIDGTAEKKLIKLHESAEININELKKNLSESDLMFFKYFENYFEVKAMTGYSFNYYEKMIGTNGILTSYLNLGSIEIENLPEPLENKGISVIPHEESKGLSLIPHEENEVDQSKVFFKEKNDDYDKSINLALNSLSETSEIYHQTLKNLIESGKEHLIIALYGESIGPQPKDYFFKLSHRVSAEINFKKIAFGRPTLPNNSLMISKLEIFKLKSNGEKIDLANNEFIFIDYDSKDQTKEIEIENTINFKMDEELFFLIGIEANNIFLGLPLNNDKVTITDDNEKEMKITPIFYLTS